ncbi:DUF6359 domain-containing protein [Dysgonomonas macrotermitis]|uniref:Uncharacterized protein n=1 Tax=Dysgonomonas macrotermitis TaxID=1346286 RepID=A0A1M4Y3J0_9BACT|nr:DUF6359 domain-containing protein [Dysgonomonas macrotermitis]SHF00249.1 hypothetical protein SAMN05444362_10361 [Dysgonomonas macrotermitis]
MKTLKRLSYLLLIAILATVTSCERDYDAPPLNMPEYTGDAPNITIAGLKEKYASVTSSSPQLIEESLILQARVGGNDISGNIYKQVIIQDATGGISIGVDQNSIYTTYRVGQEIFIDLKNLYIVNYGGELQIGYGTTQANRIPWENFKDQAHLNGWPDSTQVAPKVVAIKDLNVTMNNTVVQLDNVYFVNGGKTTFAVNDATTSQTLKDADGNSIDVRTSSYSNFANDLLPSGTGTLIGVLGRYNGNWQFTIRSTADIKDFGGETPTTPEGTGTGTKEDPYDITNAIAKQGENDVWVKGYIVGAVPAAVLNEAEFTAPFTSQSNLLIAASADETDPTKCFPIQLVYNTDPRNINLNQNPDNKGKEVLLRGNLTTYFGVAAMKETSEYVLEGGSTTPEPEPGTGTGTKDDPYDLANAIAKQGETGMWIKAYIVGAVPAAVLAEAEFTAPFTSQSNILVAATPNETDPTKCFPIQLKSGSDVRTNLNLNQNPGMLGKEVKLYGDLTTYFNVPGLKETSDFEVEGGTDPTPGDNDGTKEKPYTVSEYVALESGTDIWVEAYIVGNVPGSKLEEALFVAPFGSNTNILIADSPTETDVTKCVPVQLPASPASLRQDLGLVSKPEVLGSKVKLKGNTGAYFTVPGLRGVSEYEF